MLEKIKMLKRYIDDLEFDKARKLWKEISPNFELVKQEYCDGPFVGFERIYRHKDYFIKTSEIFRKPTDSEFTVSVDDAWEIKGYSLIEKAIKELKTEFTITIAPQYSGAVFFEKGDCNEFYCDYEEYAYLYDRNNEDWVLMPNTFGEPEIFRENCVLSSDEMVKFIKELSEKYNKKAA